MPHRQLGPPRPSGRHALEAKAARGLLPHAARRAISLGASHRLPQQVPLNLRMLSTRQRSRRQCHDCNCTSEMSCPFPPTSQTTHRLSPGVPCVKAGFVVICALDFSGSLSRCRSVTSKSMSATKTTKRITHRHFCLPKKSPTWSYRLHQRFTGSSPSESYPGVKFENRSRTTRSRFFQSFPSLDNCSTPATHTDTPTHTDTHTATFLPCTHRHTHTTHTQLFPSTNCLCQDWVICALTAFLESGRRFSELPLQIRTLILCYPPLPW